MINALAWIMLLASGYEIKRLGWGSSEYLDMRIRVWAFLLSGAWLVSRLNIL